MDLGRLLVHYFTMAPDSKNSWFKIVSWLGDVGRNDMCTQLFGASCESIIALEKRDIALAVAVACSLIACLLGVLSMSKQ